jgi:excisionase family DNA binding protein
MKEAENVSGPTPVVQQDQGLWVIEDVAEYLKVSVDTVRNHIKLRNLPFKRKGRLMYFRRAEIDAWVDSEDAA